MLHNGRAVKAGDSVIVSNGTNKSKGVVLETDGDYLTFRDGRSFKIGQHGNKIDAHVPEVALPTTPGVYRSLADRSLWILDGTGHWECMTARKTNAGSYMPLVLLEPSKDVMHKLLVELERVLRDNGAWRGQIADIFANVRLDFDVASDYDPTRGY